MNVLQLLMVEFGKLAAKKSILYSVIAALFVPVVYGGILLSAKWGPYDNLDNLPVAVVNNDVGALSDNEPINVGEELIANLKEGDGLGWEFVNSTTAMKGLENNEFYMVVVIPEDFSERVTTVMDPDPKKLELEYIQNQGLNFLASQVTKSAAEKIREQLGNTITQQYVTKVFTNLDQVAEGLGKAADGSSQLADGTNQLYEGTDQLQKSVAAKSADIEKLADGANQLKNGTGQLVDSLSSKQSDIAKLANGSKELKNGTAQLLQGLRDKSGDIEKLAQGSSELHAGTVELKDGTGRILEGLQTAQAGSSQLREGLVDRLSPGSIKIAQGAENAQAGSAELAAGALKLVEGLEEYKKANPTVLVGPYYQQIVDGANKLASGLNTLSTKMGTLKDGAKEISDGVGRAADGSINLNNGLNQLVEGQVKVDQGAAKVKDGANQIAGGNAQVHSGWTELINGVTKLDSGAAQISQGNIAVNQGWQALTVGATKINNGINQVSNGTQEVNKGWGTLEEGTTQLNDGAEKVNEGSQELATGLKEGADQTEGLNTSNENAEMFASPVQLVSNSVNEYELYRESSAPYVLTLGLFVGILIMSMFIDFKKPTHISSMNWFIVKFTKLATLATAQAILLLVVVLLLLKVSVTNPVGVILFSIVVSITFSAIVFFLVTLGGNIGRFIALAFVVLQLSTTGANLPIEMLPIELRLMSDYLPFTYSIAGFKSVISLDSWSGAFANMAILLGFLTLFGVLSFITVYWKNRRHKSRLDAGVSV